MPAPVHLAVIHGEVDHAGAKCEQRLTGITVACSTASLTFCRDNRTDRVARRVMDDIALEKVMLEVLKDDTEV